MILENTAIIRIIIATHLCVHTCTQTSTSIRICTRAQGMKGSENGVKRGKRTRELRNDTRIS